jgi:hypothetical protein
MSIPTLTKQGLVSFTYDTWDSRVYSSVVLPDPVAGGYRMFYTGYGTDVNNDYGPATATSTDLVNWTKPIVGLIDYPTVAGNTNNNLIIYRNNEVGSEIPMEFCDCIWAEGQFLALVMQKANSSSQLYKSPDGETWTFVQNAFLGADLNAGAYAEPKCILYDGNSYKLYYRTNPGAVAQRRSLGYYESATFDGTFVDQGVLSEFTSTDTTLQYYDMYNWLHAGKWHAGVPHYNNTTGVLGPIEHYESSDSGASWTYVNTLLEMGTTGEFDDELIAACKPILVNNHWYMMYVGSSEPHNTWPRPMVFATATGREDTDMSLTYHAPYTETKSIAPSVGPTPTVVRAGNTASYFDANGVLQFAPANTARIDHDPVTGECLGLLVEEARTNIAIQSADLSTIWLTFQVTVDTNVAVAPDGNTAMDRINVTAGPNQHFVYQLRTFTASTLYGYSAFLQDDGSGFATLNIFGGTNHFVSVTFDLVNGTVTDSQLGATSGYLDSTLIEPIGDGGIYRCGFVGSVNATGTGTLYLSPSDSGTPTLDTTGRPIFTAVAGEDLLAWGVQFELGNSISSYIGTLAASNARNDDVISTTDVSWYNGSAGAWYVRSSSKHIGVDAVPFAIGVDASANDGWTVWYDLPLGTFSAYHGTTTGDDGLIQISDVATVDVPMNTAIAYANNDMAMYIDGVAGTPDTSVTLPPTSPPDTFYLGRGMLADFSQFHLNGHIQEIRYYDERLYDATLEKMSNGTFPGDIARKPGYLDETGVRNRRENRFSGPSKNDTSYRLGENDTANINTADNKNRNRYS